MLIVSNGNKHIDIATTVLIHYEQDVFQYCAGWSVQLVAENYNLDPALSQIVQLRQNLRIQQSRIMPVSCKLVRALWAQ